jgi:hypothetical protein
MTPSKLNLEVWRGATLRLELVAQTKTYVYDPAIHNTLLDQKRSHEENLEFYGSTYAYIDFNSTYVSAELMVAKAWDKLNKNAPLLTLNDPATEIILGDRSVIILISDDITQDLAFDSATYKLRLTKANGDVDLFTYGSFDVFGA